MVTGMDVFGINVFDRRMRILFYMGHPAHFHLLKNSIISLKENGHTIAILTKKKDILDELLINAGFEYTNILPEGRSNSKYGLLWGMIKRDLRLFRYAMRFKPDVMAGTSVEISHVGKILGISTININEDDAKAVPFYSKLAYPLADVILSPELCNNGKWEYKSVKYPSYHELAYLHPDHFSPDKSIVAKYLNPEEPYFIIRFSGLDAHHDKGILGISLIQAKDLIDLISPYGRVIINSEKELDEELEKYRLNINVLDMHHVMAFAGIYIGDSQTMAAEAGVLGVPFIRINGFVGKLSYLNELENKYLLGFGFVPDKFDEAVEKIKKLLNDNTIKEVFIERRNKMLAEKINAAEFFTWFIENYSEGIKIIR